MSENKLTVQGYDDHALIENTYPLLHYKNRAGEVYVLEKANWFLKLLMWCCGLRRVR